MKPWAQAGNAIGCSLLLALSLLGCGTDDSRIAVTEPDRAVFEAAVMPVLLRDCAFGGCHGSQERFFQVLGPGRTRLYAEQKSSDPLIAEEIEFNYHRARSMLDPTNVGDSPLLRKPLAVEAGGSGHLGTDGFGRDVYSVTTEPRFQILLGWALGQPVAGLQANGQGGQAMQPQPNAMMAAQETNP